MSRKRKTSPGLQRARKESRERIVAGHADREAAARYRDLVASGNLSSETAADYADRAIECDRIAKEKLRSTV
jgi:2-keto-3-deoxy-galactonokinase